MVKSRIAKKIGVYHLNFHGGLMRTEENGVCHVNFHSGLWHTEGWLTQPERLERLTRKEASMTMLGGEAAKIPPAAVEPNTCPASTWSLFPAHLSKNCFETYVLSSAYISTSSGHGAKKSG